jgi:chromosome segregation ATPase
MSFWDQRRKRLRQLICDVCATVQEDYFIPQMLQHQKSAAFVEERIEELFMELYKDEVHEFEGLATTAVDQVTQELNQLKLQTGTMVRDGARRSNRVGTANTEIETQYTKLLAKASELAQSHQSSVTRMRQRLRTMDQEIGSLKGDIHQLQTGLQQAEAQIQSGRRFIEQITTLQKRAISSARQSAMRTVSQDWSDPHPTHTTTAPKRRQLQKSDPGRIIALLKIANEELSENPIEIVRTAVVNARRGTELDTLAESLGLPPSRRPLSARIVNFVNDKVSARG